MPACSLCGAHTPSGRFCSECGAPFATAEQQAQTQQQTQQHRTPPRFQEQMSFEERDQKALLYQQQPSGNTPPAIPVVYVDGDGAAARANGRNLSSASSASSNAGQATGAGGRVLSSSTSGVLSGRYSDHPNCDICALAFDVSKRRHQCRACGRYVCGNCSPLMLLIPEGEQIDGAKGYDPSIPQRACLHCAPTLRPLQEDLVARFAKANSVTEPHEAKSRLHVPFSPSLEKECKNAADIVGNFFRSDSGASGDRAIPISMLENAHGLAIMTIVKAGFLIVGKVGTGIVISRLPDGSWSAPSAIGTVGLGGGFEIGGEIVEVMIILGSPAAVQVFHSPQVNLGAGLDVAVGPYGRSAAAAAAISSSGLNGNYSYSISKGLYAGISLQGSVIATRNDLNRKFYGQDLEASALLSGSVGQPMAASPLYEALDRAMRGIQEHKEVLAESPPGAGGIAGQLSMLDRFLPLWILLSAGAGIGLGQLSAVHSFIESTTVGSMNLLVGAGLLAMMYPPLANMRWELVGAVLRDRRLLLLTTFQNWVVGPMTMFLLAAGFFHDDTGFMAGFSMVGCSRCIGMVMIWIALAGGDLEYGAALIAVNSVWTMALYSFYASFFLNTMPSAMGIDDTPQEQESLHISVGEVASDVGIYMGIPFVLGISGWVLLRRWKGNTWYFEEFTPRLDVLAVVALLFTIVVLFASQSQRITTTIGPVLFSMVPFMIYFIVTFAGSFLMSQSCGATHPQSVTLAFTATSNNYELSLGVAVAIFGLDSDPAMMSVVAALIEIPTMLALVYLSLWLEKRPRKRDEDQHSMSTSRTSQTTSKELIIESPVVV
ncbi:unnamed protein product [Phytophthora lilii]|uniref:Unnamed protein product n=1 Tax=Phytophthora lilii TaxID=2077276 RepID=A0A9W6TK69_9STRA|nr:unnamed protein product [Phytophthora lilii]